MVALHRGELWLLEPKGPSPKPILSCTRRQSGRDWMGSWTIWSGGRPSRSPCTAACTTIRSGRPRRCSPTTPSSSISAFAAAGPLGRTTRPALAREFATPIFPRTDRVDVLIDLDRDFATYYRLTIDHRGWTNDSCCGDSTWDPKWYVAARSEGGYWTVEAAIPLRELTSRPPAANEAWAIGLQRTVPGVGFQSWTVPASTDVLPEGFGYLVF